MNASNMMLFLVLTIISIFYKSTFALPRVQKDYKSETCDNVLVVLGASGDLAQKKIYPTLWNLFRDNNIPNTRIVGYARSDLNISDYLRKYVEKYVALDEKTKFEQFISANSYMKGAYDKDESFKALDQLIRDLSSKDANRIFYLALPPSVYKTVSTQIKQNCMASKPYFTRVVLEKPFGSDLESSNDLSAHLSNLFSEDQIYRIDHYLGKEMIRNIIALRFGNNMFDRIWSKESIQSVMITFKEPFGTWGRGGYFDSNGMIRDVVQNHLLQFLSLIAMEPPKSLNTEDIREEKVKLLQNIPEIQLEDVILGQYIANKNGVGEQTKGYLDDPTVPAGSNTSTLACMVLRIKNSRWDGVPFIINSGKALDEHRVNVRIQYKNPGGGIFSDSCARNELIMQVQPSEKVMLKITNKKPGLSFSLVDTTLDLDYKIKFNGTYTPAPYEPLLLDIFKGNQANFVRSDELSEAWRIFTPVLHRIESEKIKPIPYIFGVQSLPEVEQFIADVGKFKNDNDC